MSEQVLDLRLVVSTLRRLRRPLLAAAVIGGGLGVLMVPVFPPQYTSSAQVLLPAQTTESGQPSARDAATERRVALSDVVLAPAAKSLQPPMSLEEARARVDVSPASSDVLEFTAKGTTAKEAEALAQASADSEVEYQTSAASSLSQIEQASLKSRENELRSQLDVVGTEIDKTKARLEGADGGTQAARDDAATLAQLVGQQSDLVLKLSTLQDSVDSAQTGVASVIQAATPAERPLVWRYYAVWAVIGALVAALLVAISGLARGRRDRRLGTRDEIAGGLGATVLASVRGRVPRDAAGWSTLLQTYEPDAVERWALRQAMEQLGIPAPGSTDGMDDRSGASAKPVDVVLVALADDLRGLAAAVQLASHTASLGVTTGLSTLGQHPSANACWTALSTYAPGEEARPNLFVTSRRKRQSDLQVHVRLAVLDRKEPHLERLRPAASAVAFCLAAGAATAEDLARAAVVVFEAKGRIRGAIVADPDSLDRTTGRFGVSDRAQETALPSPLTGFERRSSRHGPRGSR